MNITYSIGYDYIKITCTLGKTRGHTFINKEQATVQSLTGIINRLQSDTYAKSWASTPRRSAVCTPKST